jgi:hypothetical protein
MDTKETLVLQLQLLALFFVSPCSIVYNYFKFLQVLYYFNEQ